MSRVLLVIVTSFVLATAPGAAEGATVECGQPVTEDAVLDRDLRCGGDGPQMTTGDVTLDLGGHTIRGSGSGTGILVRPCDQTGTLVVRNGAVRGFGIGVRVAADRGCDHDVATTVEGLAIMLNERGVVGGVAGGQTGPTVLRGNTIRANAGNGVTTGFIRAFRVLDNAIMRNGGDGVAAFQDSIDRLEGNVIAQNGGNGAFVADSVSRISGNRFMHNGGIGLTLNEQICAFRERYFLSGNTAMHNLGGGMQAAFPLCADPTLPPPGDGNVAKHNLTFQCVVIRCVSGP